MNTTVPTYAAAITLLLVCTEAFLFVAPSPSAIAATRLSHRPSRQSRIVLATTSSDSGEGGGDAPGTVDQGEYDFEAGFRDRLAKEGGVAGVQMKAAKRSVDAASKVAQRQVATSAQKAATSAKGASDSLLSDIGLLSRTDWGLTLLSLGAVVIIAIASQFASPPPKSFSELPTTEKLERLNSAREPEVTFGRAGFKI